MLGGFLRFRSLVLSTSHSASQSAGSSCSGRRPLQNQGACHPPAISNQTVAVLEHRGLGPAWFWAGFPAPCGVWGSDPHPRALSPPQAPLEPSSPSRGSQATPHPGGASPCLQVPEGGLRGPAGAREAPPGWGRGLPCPPAPRARLAPVSAPGPYLDVLQDPPSAPVPQLCIAARQLLVLLPELLHQAQQHHGHCHGLRGHGPGRSSG